ncbi:hypothetical protein VTJ49DRAFT_5506 [Mycothermus thermophilus]|uniref:Uncharacterized protein n=1 Tax=Humicola insolens TaxID=85995 RepID=A0ABR3VKW7_HUMIN
MQLTRLSTLATCAILAVITSPLSALAQDGPDPTITVSHGLTPTIDYVSGCAAVVSTVGVCSTCYNIQCVIPATITAGCGSCAADAVPTIYRSFPCPEDGGCPGLGCKTIFTVVTASGDECAEVTASPTPTGDAVTPPPSTAGAARMKALRWW